VSESGIAVDNAIPLVIFCLTARFFAKTGFIQDFDQRFAATRRPFVVAIIGINSTSAKPGF
jgi:hypothetical protein